MSQSLDDWDDQLLEEIGHALRTDHLVGVVWVLDTEDRTLTIEEPGTHRDTGRYRVLPTMWGTGGRLNKFVHSLADADLAEACRKAMVGGRGAYRRVRDVLQARDLESLWFDFQTALDRRDALDWLHQERLITFADADEE